jgi:hypothetical protein
VQGGKVAVVEFDYDVLTGDSTVNGRSFADEYRMSSEYAASGSWFTEARPIIFGGRKYIKHGPPTWMRPDLDGMGQAGTYLGVPVLARERTGVPPDTIYLLPRPGCELQAYAAEPGAAADSGPE